MPIRAQKSISNMKNKSIQQRGTYLVRKIGWLFVLILVPQAQGAVINFTDLPGGGTLPWGTILTNQYATLGVNFSAFEDGNPTNSYLSLIGNPANSWSNWNITNNIIQADILRMDFSNPVSQLEWETETYGPSQVTFQAFDSNGSLLETVSINSTPDNLWAPTSFSTSNISRVDAHQPTDFWQWGVDNLSFVIVPEPSTTVLLVLGLMGVSCRRRHRT